MVNGHNKQLLNTRHNQKHGLAKTVYILNVQCLHQDMHEQLQMVELKHPVNRKNQNDPRNFMTCYADTVRTKTLLKLSMMILPTPKPKVWNIVDTMRF